MNEVQVCHCFILFMFMGQFRPGTALLSAQSSHQESRKITSDLNFTVAIPCLTWNHTEEMFAPLVGRAGENGPSGLASLSSSCITWTHAGSQSWSLTLQLQQRNAIPLSWFQGACIVFEPIGVVFCKYEASTRQNRTIISCYVRVSSRIFTTHQDRFSPSGKFGGDAPNRGSSSTVVEEIF